MWATLGRRLQLWVPLEEVGKTSMPAGKATRAPAAVKVEQSPPPAPPARLKFESNDEGRVPGQKPPRQPGASSSSRSSSCTENSSKVEEVNPEPPKPPKKKKAAPGKRKGQATG